VENLARALIILGGIIAAIGLLLFFAPKIPFLGNSLGKLPGDIYIKRDNFTFYFPLATSIIISIILSVIFYFLRK